MSGPFDAERWTQIERLFNAALTVDAARRNQFVSDESNGDNEVREEVLSLLEASAESDGFLDKPVAGAAKAVKEVAAEVRRDRLQQGARISHYEIVSKIAAGGMGEVYVATDTILGRRVALKILARDLTRDESILARFRQEAQAASALNHPNIVTIFEFGQADGLHYIASEYVEGSTLREILAKGRLELSAAVDIGCQILSALAAAHALGILHRDVKPENVILRPDGVAKLVDFGIAKLSEVRTDISLPQTHTLRPLNQTQPGIVIGTVRYMSPEQAQGLSVDARSDAFSAGVVMYEMLAGTAPFDGEDTRQTVYEIINLHPPALTGFAPDVPPELEHIVGKALRKDRGARYQSAKDLLVDLQLFQKDVEFQTNLKRAGYVDGAQRRTPVRNIQANARASHPATRASWWGTRGAFWSLAVALVVLLAAGVVLLRRLGSIPTAPDSGAAQRPLAVLPFRNLNHDPQLDFLQFSLADSVIMKLGYVKALVVRPSSSIEMYRDTNLAPQEIASRLHVHLLLTGGFIKDGNNLRITTQLVDVQPNTILWRDTIDVTYDKLLTVQDQVTQQIIAGLALKLSPAETKRITSERPANKNAYEYYLRGVDFYGLNEFDEAAEMLQKSITLEPGYAPAWAQLGRVYTTRASLEFGGSEQYVKAKMAYEKALALDPGLPDVQVYMANLLTDTGRAEQAVPLLREALRSNPGNAEAHWELGYAYRFGGMLRESITEAEEARRLDPEVKINSSAINSYLYIGEYQRFLQSLPANNAVYMLFYRGFAEYYLHQFTRAENYFDQAYQMNPMLMPAPLGKALSYGLMHDKRRALELMNGTAARMKERGVKDPEMLYKIAQVYAVLGDTSSALSALQQSIEGGFFCYPYFVKDPLLDNLRQSVEFQKLMNQARDRHLEFKARFFDLRASNGI